MTADRHSRGAWWLYRSATAVSLALAAPVLIARRPRHYGETLRHRLGWIAEKDNRAGGAAVSHDLWLHAVSVGEVGVAATLIAALPRELSLLVTTVTPTGQERARRLLGNRATVDYLPFDLEGPIRRFLDRHRPRRLILIEGEYWPLLLCHVRQRGIHNLIVNGRISDRTFRRLLLLRGLARHLYTNVDAFAVQSEQDRERLTRLRVARERISVTGNLKYETPEPPRLAALEESVRGLAGDRAVWIAGSTMPGEEEQVLDAFARAGGGDDAFLLIGPRHPDRFDAVARLLEDRSQPFVRRSGLAQSTVRASENEPRDRPAILLLDSLGELASLYRIAHAAFIGGTLSKTGGHNPLEAARFGVPVLVGPSMENFHEIAAAFDQAGAWQRVADANELAAGWRQLLEDPSHHRRLGAAGKNIVEQNRGALAKTLHQVELLFSLGPKTP